MWCDRTARFGCGGGEMDQFREQAFYLMVWRTILAGLIAILLMVTQSIQLSGAFLIGANVALLFAVGLMLWAAWLNEAQIERSGPWRSLRPDQRPAGVAGRRWARNQLEEIGLRFAKAASGVAIALSGSALALANA